jgi:hypothetical protein
LSEVRSDLVENFLFEAGFANQSNPALFQVAQTAMEETA